MYKFYKTFIFFWPFLPIYLATSQPTFVFMKTSWRRFEHVFHLRFQKASTRQLGQDQYIRLCHTSSRRLQDIFKTSLRRLKTSCQNVFNCFEDVYLFLSAIWKLVKHRSSRLFEEVFKTFSRHLQDVLQRYLQDIFKAYHQAKLFLLTVFEKYSTRFWEVLFQRRLSTEEFA